METLRVTARQLYVIDTNAIIDLNEADLISDLFQLPCSFVVSDFVQKELLHPPFTALLDLGLSVLSLSPDSVRELMGLIDRYPQPSYADLSVMVLAKQVKRPLLTGDRALIHVAVAQGVEWCGTCWLLDYMVNSGVITPERAITALQRMRLRKRNPPQDECRQLVMQWKKYRGIF
ncbi:MAG: hypothetical protein D5R99_00885 [Methanocalculus sp. MSAO_Arc1]|nr:MAG: hypothetical protein D5R99_00885 [Methanocalculus sp. MSAO_Arc1]